jgi:beta-exotoxin I transport system permease protein
MLRSVFGKTLWDQRRSLLGWAIGITAVGAFYASFYPLVNTPEMIQALESYPSGMLEALGMTDATSVPGYLGSTTFGLLGPTLVIVFAAAIGGSAIAGEEESGRLDLTLAHPVSRWSVLMQRFAAIGVAMLGVCLVLAAVLLAISGPFGLGEVAPANMVAASVQLAAFGVLFGGLALAAGAATGRRSVAFALVAIVGVVGYFGNNLGPTIEGLGWLRDVSPYRYFSGGEPLRNGFQLADTMVLLAVSVLLVAIGGLRFDRRDVAV